MRVLIIEDSDNLRASLVAGLSREGFAVDAAADGRTGLGLARNNPYDVLVLDLLLPEIDGMTILAQLRANEDRPHVLVLTARDRVQDRVEGLNAGADDYLVKPFAFEELLARLRNLVRRRYQEKAPPVRLGALEVDFVGRRATMNGALVDLTAREYSLLEFLLLRKGDTVGREEIEDHLYGVHRLPASNAVDSAVCNLRTKLGPLGKDMIRTRRGQGYALEEPPA